jgi:hypothetical protein
MWTTARRLATISIEVSLNFQRKLGMIQHYGTLAWLSTGGHFEDLSHLKSEKTETIRDLQLHLPLHLHQHHHNTTLQSPFLHLVLVKYPQKIMDNLKTVVNLSLCFYYIESI